MRFTTFIDIEARNYEAALEILFGLEDIPGIVFLGDLEESDLCE